MPVDDLGPVFRALADPTRRAILELLRCAPRPTGEVCAAFPRLSRFGVVKHLGILRAAGLVQVRATGRTRWNRIDPSPLEALLERWLRPFEALGTSRPPGPKRAAGADASAPPPAPLRRPRLSLDVEPPDSRARSPGAAHRPIRRRRP